LTGALVAAVPGVLDLRTIRRGEPAFAAARAHLILNAAAAALFAIGYAWRAGDHVALDKTRWGQLALSAIAVAFLLAATWLGGKLTYYHGIRVTAQAGHQDGASRRRLRHGTTCGPDRRPRAVQPPAVSRQRGEGQAAADGRHSRRRPSTPSPCALMQRVGPSAAGARGRARSGTKGRSLRTCEAGTAVERAGGRRRDRRRSRGPWPPPAGR